MKDIFTRNKKYLNHDSLELIKVWMFQLKVRKLIIKSVKIKSRNISYFICNTYNDDVVGLPAFSLISLLSWITIVQVWKGKTFLLYRFWRKQPVLLPLSNLPRMHQPVVNGRYMRFVAVWANKRGLTAFIFCSCMHHCICVNSYYQ